MIMTISLKNPWNTVRQKFDDIRLGREMVSAFDKATDSAQIEFIQKIPEYMEQNPELADTVFRIVYGVVEGESNRMRDHDPRLLFQGVVPKPSDLYSATIEILPPIM